MRDYSQVQTLNDYIRYGKTSSYSIPRVIFVSKEIYNDDHIVFLDELAYSKYDQLITTNSVIIELTPEEQAIYKYNPQALSTYLYGTPNLDHLILYLNKCSEFEFTPKRVKLIMYSRVESILKTILQHEESNMNEAYIDATTF